MKIVKERYVQIDYDEMKRRIDEKGLTLKDVASEIGWTSGYLNRDKVAKRGGIRKIDAEHIAKILECEVDDITLKVVEPAPEEMPEGKPILRTAADLTNEELIQELMKRLLK